MRAGRKIRVMMLGWEYPPRLAGGLGKACQGLSQAMARQESQVFFVLPTFPERVSEPHLEVVGAQEALTEAGYDLQQTLSFSEETFGIRLESSSSSIQFIHSDAKLFPYGAHPDGEIPEMVRRFIDQGNEGAEYLYKSGNSGSRDQSGSGLRDRSRSSANFKSPARSRLELVKRERPAPDSQRGSKPDSKAGKEIYGKNLWSEIERFTHSVRHMAETHEVDVVHAHDWMTFPAAFEFAKLSGVPVFLHVHATEYDRSGENLNNEVFRIERESFRRATHIFAVSKYTAGIIERLYGINRQKISVAYNAPDDNEKNALAAPAADDRVTFEKAGQVVFLGRLTFQKGPDHFLKAAQLVLQVSPHTKFVFCGTGDMMDKLRAMAFQLGIEANVHFAGFVEPRFVDEVLLHSKVLVMPSVSEPFGLVALEAIRCGIPVILSKQSGVREVLNRALQVDFWDHEKLADQIIAALTLPDLSRQLVNEGLVQIQKLSWDSTAEKVVSVYRKYLGSTLAQSIEGAHGH